MELRTLEKMMRCFDQQHRTAWGDKPKTLKRVADTTTPPIMYVAGYELPQLLSLIVMFKYNIQSFISLLLPHAGYKVTL